jgi:hypothetical protein
MDLVGFSRTLGRIAWGERSLDLRHIKLLLATTGNYQEMASMNLWERSQHLGPARSSFTEAVLLAW